MIVADELDADWKRVTIQQGLGDEKYGDRTPTDPAPSADFYEPLREAGATARTMLESAAATKWGVPAATNAAAKNHEVIHAGVGSQSWLMANWLRSPPKNRCRSQETLKLKSPSEFRYIGKNMPITDLDGHRRRQGHVRHGRAHARDGLRLHRALARHRRQAQERGRLRSATRCSGVSQTVTIRPVPGGVRHSSRWAASR